MSNVPAPTGKGGLRAWVGQDDVHQGLRDAVGDVMDADQFIAQMMTAFQAPEVKQCSDTSKFTALHTCAAMGLLPTLDQVKLIPYKNEIKAMPQWQGLKALMERHPAVLEVTASLVHVDDAFSFENGNLKHSYDPFNESRSIEKIGDIKGGYCTVVYTDGRPPKHHFVTAKQIDKCRKCAQTQKVWAAWFESMALKTVYRDAYARRVVPMDPLVQSRISKVFEIEDVNLGNNPARIQSQRLESHIEQAKRLREQESVDTIVDAVVTEDAQDAEPVAEEAKEETVGQVDAWMTAVKECEDMEDLAQLEMELDEENGLSDGQKQLITDAMKQRSKELQ